MKGSKEIGFTVLSMSTSLIAVFIPILLMGGIVGRLFREFAVTLGVAIAVSLLVSLTTTPMLCARFLSQRIRANAAARYLPWRAILQWDAGTGTIAALRWVLRHQTDAAALRSARSGLNVYLFIIVPKGFFPQQDTGRLGGAARASQDISFRAMSEKQKQLAQIVLNDPAWTTVTAFAGSGGGGATTNVGCMFVALKPLSERKASCRPGRQSAARKALQRSRRARLFLQAQQDIQVGGRGSDAQYQYTLQDSQPGRV